MQFRELASSECGEAYALLSTLRSELTLEVYLAYLSTASPHTYRPLGAFERGGLQVYAGVSIHENLELGRYLLVDDFVAREGSEKHSREMIDYLGDYAKMHTCKKMIVWGIHRGIRLADLEGFRPKRDGFIKIF